MRLTSLLLLALTGLGVACFTIPRGSRSFDRIVATSWDRGEPVALAQECTVTKRQSYGPGGVDDHMAVKLGRLVLVNARGRKPLGATPPTRVWFTIEHATGDTAARGFDIALRVHTSGSTEVRTARAWVSFDGAVSDRPFEPPARSPDDDVSALCRGNARRPARNPRDGRLAYSCFSPRGPSGLWVAASGRDPDPVHVVQESILFEPLGCEFVDAARRPGEGHGLVWANARDAVYWCDHEGGHGVVVDLSGKTARSQTVPCLLAPAWSPDDRRIAGARDQKLETFEVPTPGDGSAPPR